ncbi:MAG: hypothetical protein ABTQ27_06655 [Amaricoccus sp.]|uniref:hypothetical protein n=1 Tax=Amaricoccus sp. TaxID=1872485 RepID=UPI0033150EC9
MGSDLHTMSGRKLDTLLAALCYRRLGPRAAIPAEFQAMADNSARRLGMEEAEARFERRMFAGFTGIDRRGGGTK